ncbi:hypothetical protein FISHEDRAFT_49082 [Fistulina hepatica ATCC 64428]|uniref:RlpA-like protein double-psi beta-barrel domain-containing protein n=1 Tax=Fistulina hepatica ATCC 64428 TaxID=1128425 RepID=A0A0D7A443_9AGAR|nr:hypothetical protein FISHEDRAFT_49082 [Fistulina hepatica ATCC 64428]
MLFSHVAFWCTVFGLFITALAVPVPQSGTVVSSTDLERRVTHTGRGTWYEVGLGNCGYTDTDADYVVAIAKARYDDNDGANCNQWIEIVNTDNGNTAYGQTRDSCQACGYDDLDMSPALFEEFGDLDTGVLPIEWHFKNMDWSP